MPALAFVHFIGALLLTAPFYPILSVPHFTGSTTRASKATGHMRRIRNREGLDILMNACTSTTQKHPAGTYAQMTLSQAWSKTVFPQYFMQRHGMYYN